MSEHIEQDKSSGVDQFGGRAASVIVYDRTIAVTAHADVRFIDIVLLYRDLLYFHWITSQDLTSRRKAGLASEI